MDDSVEKIGIIVVTTIVLAIILAVSSPLGNVIMNIATELIIK